MRKLFLLLVLCSFGYLSSAQPPALTSPAIKKIDTYSGCDFSHGITTCPSHQFYSFSDVTIDFQEYVSRGTSNGFTYARSFTKIAENGGYEKLTLPAITGTETPNTFIHFLLNDGATNYYIENAADGIVVFDNTMTLTTTIPMNLDGLVHASIHGDKIMMVRVNPETSIVTYDLSGTELFSANLALEDLFINLAYTQSGLLVFTDKGTYQLDENLNEVMKYEFITQDFTTDGLKTVIVKDKNSNTHVVDLEKSSSVVLGSDIDHAFLENLGNGIFIKKESVITQLDANLLVLNTFDIGDAYASLDFIKGYFFARDGNAVKVFSTEGNLLAEANQSHFFEVFNSGDFFMNEGNTLFKYNAMGGVIWQMDISFMNSDYHSFTFSLHSDESFALLKKGEAVESIAYYENDSSRCNYEAINPFSSPFCHLENNVTNQVHGQFTGNLPEQGKFMQTTNSFSYPACDFGVSFDWYQDGSFISSDCTLDLPNEMHNYHVVVKQGTCGKSSEDTPLNLLEPQQYFHFNLTANGKDASDIGNLNLIEGEPLNLTLTAERGQKYANILIDGVNYGDSAVTAYLSNENEFAPKFYSISATGQQTFSKSNPPFINTGVCQYTSPSFSVSITDSIAVKKALNPSNSIPSPQFSNAAFTAPSLLSLDILGNSSYSSSHVQFGTGSPTSDIFYIGHTPIIRNSLLNKDVEFNLLNGRTLDKAFSYSREAPLLVNNNSRFITLTSVSDTYLATLDEYAFSEDRITVIDSSASLIAEMKLSAQLDGIQAAHINESSIYSVHAFPINFSLLDRQVDSIALKQIDFLANTLDSIIIPMQKYYNTYAYGGALYVFGDRLLIKPFFSNVVETKDMEINPVFMSANMIYHLKSDSLYALNLDNLLQTYVSDSVIQVIGSIKDHTFLLKSSGQILKVDNASLNLAYFTTIHTGAYLYETGSTTDDFLAIVLKAGERNYKNYLFDTSAHLLSAYSMFNADTIYTSHALPAKLSQIGEFSYYATEGTLFKLSPSADLLWAKNIPYASDYSLLINEDEELVAIEQTALNSRYQYMFALEADNQRCSYTFTSDLPDRFFCKDNTMQLFQGFGTTKGASNYSIFNVSEPFLMLPAKSFGINNKWYQDGNFIKEQVSIDAISGHTYQVGVTQEGCEVLSEEVDYTQVPTLLTATPENIYIDEQSQLNTFCGTGSELIWLDTDLIVDNPLVSPMVSTTYKIQCKTSYDSLYLNYFKDKLLFQNNTNTCLSDIASVNIIVEARPLGVIAELTNTVYPNPVTEQILHIHTELDLKGIRIFNQSGQLIDSFDGFHNTIKLDKSKYPTGTYLLNLDAANTTLTKKLIIE